MVFIGAVAFFTLDWPKTDNPHFQHYFPSSVLVTGFDIIFFWVARMAMMSKHIFDKRLFTMFILRVWCVIPKGEK